MKDILLALLKILGFLLALPLVVAFIIAFQTQILSLPVNIEAWLLWGVVSYIALYLFVYDFKKVYEFGRALMDKMFSQVKILGYLLPIYSLFLIIVYIVALLLGRGAAWSHYFIFAIAFTPSMHLVLTAHEIYEADNSVLKSHYFLVFGAVLIANLFVMSLLLAWAIPEYSLLGFIKSLVSHTSYLYKSIYRALFVD